MPQTIIWSTTAEKFEQRKKASSALSKLYEIEWQVLESAQPPLMVPKSERSFSSSVIYLFELDSDFALDQCRLVQQTFKYSQKTTRAFLLIGLLTESNMPNRSTLQEWLPILDGVMTQSTALADELAMMFSDTPIRYVPLPVTRLHPEQQFFIDSFSVFINAVKLAKVGLTAMKKVSDELLYLSVDDDALVIDSVAEVLTHLCWFQA
ncbi:MAG: hypothetical protein P4L53_21195 [Candidatus Obscuribacterales bacterium]|nr:hypothetical protein [Candidatus Obscuribacterales bacterium]